MLTPPQVAEFLQRFLGASFCVGSGNAETGDAPQFVPWAKAEVQALIKQITKNYLLTGKEDPAPQED